MKVLIYGGGAVGLIVLRHEGFGVQKSQTNLIFKQGQGLRYAKLRG